MGYPKLVEGPNGELELPAMGSVHGREVTGGSFPAEIWRKFMKEATEGMDMGTFDLPTAFPGREIGSETQPPTTTPQPSTTPTSADDTTTTTPRPTHTTIPLPRTNHP